STSIGLGMRLLKQVKGINFGPQITTWQSLITHVAEAGEMLEINGEEFTMSCVTISLSEFGSFFDPSNRELVDNLTDMWDGKLGTIVKETKTNGSDTMVNPWINILACTTPEWISDNFNRSLVGTGFGSRPVFVYADRPNEFISYPKRNQTDKREQKTRELDLVEGLQEIAKLKGEYLLTEEAYEWGDQWYVQFMENLLKNPNKTEAGFQGRRQTHVHKLAMVISASKGEFPMISKEILQEAEQRVRELDKDVTQIFSFIGQSALSRTAREMMEILSAKRSILKQSMYRTYFFRSMTVKEFDEALASAEATGQVVKSDGSENPLLIYKG
ncbi:MAG: hypothetical protein ACREQ5_18470, partial [Candidatus Dormibacteria bacterium]